MRARTRTGPPSWLPAAFSVLLALPLLLPARAALAGDTSEIDPISRSHYKAGLAMFEYKRYLDAIREFDAGYQRSKKSKFLLNIAQTYRVAGYLGAARDYYRRFLIEAPPDSTTEREQINEIVAELERTIAATGPGPAPPPIVPPPKIITSVIVRSLPAPKAKRWPIWLGIGIGGALVIGGVVAGVVVGTRTGDTQLPLENARP